VINSDEGEETSEEDVKDNPFDSKEENFDEDKNYVVNPYGNTGLDDIKEEEEIPVVQDKPDDKNMSNISHSELPSSTLGSSHNASLGSTSNIPPTLPKQKLGATTSD